MKFDIDKVPVSPKLYERIKSAIKEGYEKNLLPQQRVIGEKNCSSSSYCLNRDNGIWHSLSYSG